MSCKNFQTIFFALLIIFSVSCNISQEEKKIEYSTKKLEHSISRFSIAIDSTQNFSYNVFAVYQATDSEFLVAYNPHAHSLDLFDIQAKQNAFTVKLMSEGPNGISEDVRGLFVHNFDSIFILQEYMLSVIDTGGTVQKHIRLNEPSENNIYNLCQLYASNEFNISFNAVTQKIYIEKYAMASMRTVEFYKENIETELDTGTGKFQDFDISYPDIYKEADECYGFLQFPARTINKALHVYSFPADPYLYIYNTTDRTTTSVNGKSKNQHSPTPTLPRGETNGEKMLQHMTTSPYYGKLIYDSYRNLYYRFFYLEQSIVNDDGTFNSFGDKDMSVIIYDSTFAYVDEIILPPHTYSTSSTFVAKDGLYIGAHHYKNENITEDSLVYDIFKFTTYE